MPVNQRVSRRSRIMKFVEFLDNILGFLCGRLRCLTVCATRFMNQLVRFCPASRRRECPRTTRLFRADYCSYETNCVHIIDYTFPTVKG